MREALDLTRILMSACNNGNISQVLSSQCCPIFKEDGTIILVNEQGSTAEISPNGNVAVNLVAPSADPGNLLTQGSDNGVYFNLGALPIGPSGDVGNLLSLGSDGKTFFDGSGLPPQGISSDPGNVLNLGSDNKPFLGSSTIAAAQTVTNLSYNPLSHTLTYINEAQTVSTIDLSQLGQSGISADSGQLLQFGTDGLPLLTDQSLSNLKVLNLSGGPDLSTLSSGPHPLSVGDGLHFYSDNTIVFEAFAGAVMGRVRISTDNGNLISVGNDGGLFFNPAHIPDVGISTGAGNLLTLGLDNLPLLTDSAVKNAQTLTQVAAGVDPYSFLYVDEALATTTVQLNQAQEVVTNLYNPGDSIASGDLRGMFVVPPSLNGWLLDSVVIGALGAGASNLNITLNKAINGIVTTEGSIPLSASTYTSMIQPGITLTAGETFFFTITSPTPTGYPDGITATFSLKSA